MSPAVIRCVRSRWVRSPYAPATATATRTPRSRPLKCRGRAQTEGAAYEIFRWNPTSRRAIGSRWRLYGRHSVERRLNSSSLPGRDRGARRSAVRCVGVAPPTCCRHRAPPDRLSTPVPACGREYGATSAARVVTMSRRTSMSVIPRLRGSLQPSPARTAALGALR